MHRSRGLHVSIWAKVNVKGGGTSLASLTSTFYVELSHSLPMTVVGETAISNHHKQTIKGGEALSLKTHTQEDTQEEILSLPLICITLYIGGV